MMMNTELIEKALSLLNGAKLEDLRNLLMYERQKSILESSGKKMKLALIVKRILKKNETVRPVLSTVMYDKQNRPCICDGFLLVRWNEEQPELKAFPETRDERGLAADNIIPKKKECEARELTEADRLVIKNIDKYIKLYADEKANGQIPVELFGKTFDAYLVRDFVGVIGTDFDEIYTQPNRWGKFENTPSVVFNADYDAVILPLQIQKEEAKQASEERTTRFIEQLKV